MLRKALPPPHATCDIHALPNACNNPLKFSLNGTKAVIIVYQNYTNIFHKNCTRNVVNLHNYFVVATYLVSSPE
jgi:hypothetical protein